MESEFTKDDISKEKVEELTDLIVDLFSGLYGEKPTLVQLMTAKISLDIVSNLVGEQLDKLGYTCGVKLVDKISEEKNH